MTGSILDAQIVAAQAAVRDGGTDGGVHRHAPHRRLRLAPGAAWLRLPAGWLFAGAGVLICVALLSGVDFSGSVILLVTIIIGGLNWLAVRK